jgi:hypothetical protein
MTKKYKKALIGIGLFLTCFTLLGTGITYTFSYNQQNANASSSKELEQQLSLTASKKADMNRTEEINSLILNTGLTPKELEKRVDILIKSTDPKGDTLFGGVNCQNSILGNQGDDYIRTGYSYNRECAEDTKPMDLIQAGEGDDYIVIGYRQLEEGEKANNIANFAIEGGVGNDTFYINSPEGKAAKSLIALPDFNLDEDKIGFSPNIMLSTLRIKTLPQLNSKIIVEIDTIEGSSQLIIFSTDSLLKSASFKNEYTKIADSDKTLLSNLMLKTLRKAQMP